MAVQLFHLYGKFCARYALEVIVWFVTMVVAAVTLNMRSPYDICQWAFKCSNPEMNSEVNSDVVLLVIVRCGSILYTFMQMKKICRVGSMFVVLITCVYTIFAVITFSITVFHFLHKDMVIVSNALPVFLLFIDVSRMVTLTKHSLSTGSIEMLHENIAEGIAELSPSLTLDTMIKVFLFTTVGSYVQIHQLQQISCFACLSVIINYMVFTTFVPACLSVMLSAIDQKKRRSSDNNPPSWHDVRFSHTLANHEATWDIRLKIFLCLACLIPWAFHTYFATEDNANLQASFDSVLTLTPEQLFTVILLTILGFECIFKDGCEIVAHLRKKSVNSIHVKSNKTLYCSRDTLYKKNFKKPVEDVNCIPRNLEKCVELLEIGSDLLTDDEIIQLIESKRLQLYKLESQIQDASRGVAIRRKIFQNTSLKDIKQEVLQNIPNTNYDFTTATKACCENTVGYIPVPIGIAGPLLLDGEQFMVPMATTEGTLIASTSRGLKALFQSGGAKSCVYGDGMTRSPVVMFPSVKECCSLFAWLQDFYNFTLVKEKFDETSRYAQLKKVTPVVSGRLLYVRFVASTGDAMGMNMVSKGAENVLRWLQQQFPSMKVISLSGNFCTDKKPAAVNWIEGRGKSVVCEAVVPGAVVAQVLKTDVETLCNLNRCKNHIGSAMAGTSAGGFNAHAANIVTAVFIACGQDPAQVVVSSNCITTLEPSGCGKELVMTCTMPSLEVATVGGGTALEPQRACLNLLGLAGSGEEPGKNAATLAKVICGTVLAGELSLLAALATGDLVHSHMRYNRLEKCVPSNETEHSIL